MSTKPSGKRVQREASLKWVPLAQCQVNAHAQRDLQPAWVDAIVADFDLEQLGNPTVNWRDGSYWIIDGYHRTEALKAWFGEGNWEDQSYQCWAYDGLTEEQEAEMFLKLNNKLTVNSFAKFRAAVTAGREEECDVDRIVKACGLKVSRSKGDGGISAVGTLVRIYRRAGDSGLRRTLRIARDSYGDLGLDATVLDGIGLLVHRFNGELDDDRLVERLLSARGGVNGLLGKAENLRKQTGNPKTQCVAAAAVEINNAGRSGKRLPSWWRAEA